MNLGLTGKVALVAGASTGIGRAIAEVLSQEGCEVAILSRSETKLKKAADLIEGGTGNRVMLVSADVTKSADIKRAVAAVVDKLGPVDIMVCNAGGPPAGVFDTFKDPDWNIAFELNLKSTIRFCMEVVPGMKERRWGRIINVTSVAAMQPIDGLILSNTARAGVHGFTKTLANEVAAYGITVNCLCPGYTATERLKELAEHISKSSGVPVDEVRATWTQNIPAGRLAEPREMGYLAAFLASEQAGYLTGAAINLDGGFVKSI